MKRLARFAAFAFAVVAVLAALLFAASESGEVAVLTSVGLADLAVGALAPRSNAVALRIVGR